MKKLFIYLCTCALALCVPYASLEAASSSRGPSLLELYYMQTTAGAQLSPSGQEPFYNQCMPDSSYTIMPAESSSSDQEPDDSDFASSKRSDREFAAHPTAPASQRPHLEPQPESSTFPLHALAAMAQWHDLSNTNQSTTGQGKPHKCTHPGCDKAYCKKRELTKHLNTHESIRFKCTQPGCHFVSSQSGHLTIHMRTHTMKKPFKCTHPGCSFASARKDSLTTHMHKHTGEKPFKCSYRECTYATADKRSLTIHMHKHTGEKPFKCIHPGCTFASSLSGNLTVHMSIHTGEKPFKCNHPGCSYACANRGYLTQHMRIHNKNAH